MTMTAIGEKVVEIIATQGNIPPKEVTPDNNLRLLPLDSLDIVEITMRLEEQFGLDIADEDIGSDITVREIVEYVNTHIQTD